ncbi:DUF4349 domain-containing protein [Streptomyces sp. NPDC054796]
MRVHRSLQPVHALAGALLAGALVLTGCTGGQGSAGGSADGTAQDAAAPEAGTDGKKGASRGGAADGPGSAAPSRLNRSNVIRTASLTVRVEDVPKALDEARSTTEAAGGYVGKESTSRDDEGHESTRVVLRVPAEEYEEVLTGLEGAGRLLKRDSKAQDVTEQVVDVESRVKSQRASVSRIRELMDKATELDDVVKLESELASRQADLESLLARQASLKDRTDFATITLSLSETRPKAAGEDDEPGFTDALAGGWSAFVTVLRWVAVALGAVLPFAAGAALLVGLWLLVRPRLARRPAPAAADGAGTERAPEGSENH